MWKIFNTNTVIPPLVVLGSGRCHRTKTSFSLHSSKIADGFFAGLPLAGGRSQHQRRPRSGSAPPAWLRTPSCPPSSALRPPRWGHSMLAVLHSISIGSCKVAVVARGCQCKIYLCKSVLWGTCSSVRARVKAARLTRRRIRNWNLTQPSSSILHLLFSAFLSSCLFLVFNTCIQTHIETWRHPPPCIWHNCHTSFSLWFLLSDMFENNGPWLNMKFCVKQDVGFIWDFCQNRSFSFLCGWFLIWKWDLVLTNSEPAFRYVKKWEIIKFLW